eukprot:298549-Amphidinium_carterae.1
MDSRMATATDVRAALTSFVAERLGTASSAKLVFNTTLAQDDEYLKGVARLKSSAEDLKKALASSGVNGVFTRVAYHSREMAPEMILVWAPRDLQVPNLGQFLLNVQQLTRSNFGLCRSKYSLGVRTSIDLAAE